jgi:hypothetical protein
MLVEPTAGTIGFVLPQAIISANFMIKVWRALFARFPQLGVRCIISASATDESFSDSGEQEIIIVLQNGFEGPARIVELTTALTEDLVVNVAGMLNQDVPTQTLPPVMLVKNMSQAQLHKTLPRDWIIFSNPILGRIQERFVDIDALDFVRVGSEHGTKPVEYFWLPNKYWDLLEETATGIKYRPTGAAHDLVDSVTLPPIVLPHELLCPSIPRSIRDLEGCSPQLPVSSPHLHYLRYNDLKTIPNHPYYRWGELLARKRTEASKAGERARWLYAPPRPGRIFIPKKIDLTTNRTLALLTDGPMESTALARCVFFATDDSPAGQEDLEVLFAYLTSSLFLLDFIVHSRVDRAEFRRLYSSDMARLQFPDIRRWPVAKKRAVITASQAHNTGRSLGQRPTFVEAVRNAGIDPGATLARLDRALLEAIGAPRALLGALYKEILEKLSVYS